MIKSLYARVVLVFLAAVISSLTIAFILINMHFSSRIETIAQDDLISTANKIIQSYEELSPSALDEFMKGIAAVQHYRIAIIDSNGDTRYSSPNDALARGQVTENQLLKVLNGGIYRGEAEGRRSGNPDNIRIGLPFQADGVRYALFIEPAFEVIFDEFKIMLRLVLITVLIMGSLFILIASRYIVKPLQILTQATKRMAKGDFRVHMNTNRKDEIGILTESFNEMARELGMLDRMRKEFVSSVSHEIQTPLTSISGFTKALQHKKLDEASRMHYLSIIEEESTRLSRLSENLLRLSSLQHEHHKVQLLQFRLDEQLRRVVILSEPHWSVKPIKMELQLEEFLIHADKDQLDQVWINLIGNAIKFTPEQGSIRIEAKQLNRMAVVSVTDTGGGIPADELSNIFKPFYLLDKARDRSVSGNGLGLAIVKQIIDLHGGEIQVESRLDKGSTFTVKLPLNEE
jgi:signal transduction histidine kinase